MIFSCCCQYFFSRSLVIFLLTWCLQHCQEHKKHPNQFFKSALQVLIQIRSINRSSKHSNQIWVLQIIWFGVNSLNQPEKHSESAQEYCWIINALCYSNDQWEGCESNRGGAGEWLNRWELRNEVYGSFSFFCMFIFHFSGVGTTMVQNWSNCPVLLVLSRIGCFGKSKSIQVSRAGSNWKCSKKYQN